MNNKISFKRVIKIILISIICFYLFMTFTNIKDIYSSNNSCMGIYAYKLNHNITNGNCLYSIQFSKNSKKYYHIDDCGKENKYMKVTGYAKGCNLHTTTNVGFLSHLSDLLNENRCIQSRIREKIFIPNKLETWGNVK